MGDGIEPPQILIKVTNNLILYLFLITDLFGFRRVGGMSQEIMPFCLYMCVCVCVLRRCREESTIRDDYRVYHVINNLLENVTMHCMRM